MSGGAKRWFFPDGFLPEKNTTSGLESHEALMILNTRPEPVDVVIDIYFEDRSPIKKIQSSVDGERVRTYRLDNPEHLGGTILMPLQQYALKITASKPVVVQFGRIDTTQTNLAYYTGVGYCEK